MRQVLSYCNLLLFLLACASISAQGENPFEIKERIGTVVPDSLSKEADSFSLDEHVSFVEKRQQLLIEENPFNVSHIPITKEKVEKEKVGQVETPTTIDTAPVKEKKPLAVRPSVGTTKFIFWFFLLQLLLITSILGINREFIKKINRSISNDNFAKLVSRDFNSGYNALFAIMYALFILSLSIFIFLSIKQLYGVGNFSRYLLIIVSVLGVYLFRHIFLGFMSFVFPFTKTISYYNFMIILFNSYLGLLLIPVNVLIAYAPEWIANIAFYAGLAFILITYLLRLLRGSLHGYTLVSKHTFHFFLYLCTCEVAPIFILVKFLSNSFSI